MDALIELFLKTVTQVWLTFLHNWPFLLGSVAFAAALSLYVDARKVSGFLKRNRQAGILAATAAAVGTPLCSCGTTAIVLGMMAGMMPWAPIVAFMVASPLTSPEELVYSAGLFGWPFAIAFFVSSIVLGLAGGGIAGFLEGRGWLAGQARLATGTSKRTAQASVSRAGCGCDAPVKTSVTTCGCSQGAQTPTPPEWAPVAACACGEASAPVAVRGFAPVINPSERRAPAISRSTVMASACGCSESPATFAAGMPVVAVVEAPACGCIDRALQSNPGAQGQGTRVTLSRFLLEMFTHVRRLLPMFFGFAFIGYFLNGLIPTEWVTAVFGGGNTYSVPLAATLGLPLYINTEASLPLVRALIDSGMSQGAALAFLITGSGTSFGAVAGMLTIARWRVIALVVGTLWVGGMVMGFLYDLMLAAGSF